MPWYPDHLLVRPGLNIFFALLLAFASCRPAPPPQNAVNAPFRDAYSKEIEALQWANRYRASGPALFEQRYQDAQKASEEMWMTADHHDPRQHNLALRVRACMDQLAAYRQPSHGVNDAGQQQQTDLDRADAAGTMLDNCVEEVKIGF
jgi:hypothetical protein